MKTILVAVDDSPRAAAVIKTGIDLAQRTGAKIRLLRAVGLPPELPTNAWALPTQVVDDALLRAKRELAELAQNVPPELLVGATAQVGIPWDAICSFAKEHEVDLIVIGSHGYRLLDRLIGTTAAKVVNHADRSVLVVREPDGAAAHAA